jgi:hypothetical protein
MDRDKTHTRQIQLVRTEIKSLLLGGSIQCKIDVSPIRRHCLNCSLAPEGGQIMRIRIYGYRPVVACLLSIAASGAIGLAQDKKSSEKAEEQPRKPAEAPDEHKETLESLTKLRREQKKRDPIAIEVEIPKDLHATTRELPDFSVALKNVDEEKSPVRMWRFGHGGGQPWRWGVEIRDATGKIVPLRDQGQIEIAGAESLRQLAFGEEWKGEVSLGDHVRIKEPGEYTVRVLYDCKQGTFRSRDGESDSSMMCTSKEFKLKVGKPIPKVVEVPAGSREQAKKLVAALSDDGPIRLIHGNLRPSLYDFMDPKTPEGQLFKMGRDALPGLLDALRDEKLSFHRRGWVLGILYTLTNERDLDPFSWEKGEGVTPAYEIRGFGSASGGGGQPDLAKQRKFAQEWLKLAAECWDFKEMKK